MPGYLRILQTHKEKILNGSRLIFQPAILLLSVSSDFYAENKDFFQPTFLSLTCRLVYVVVYVEKAGEIRTQRCEVSSLTLAIHEK